MAKQAGDIFITGTYDDLCFYKMEEQYYVRIKSSLTRNRVRKSAAFANAMKSANELGIASVLASRVYRTLAKDNRKVPLYRKMTGIAKLLLKQGESNEKITELLEKYVDGLFTSRKPVAKPVVKKRLVKKRRLFRYIIYSENYSNPKTSTIRRKSKRRRRSIASL